MLRKQEAKFLILSDLSDFNEKEVLAELDELKRRHFDIVAVIGNTNERLMREISAQFESALIAALPKTRYSQSLFNELGIIDFNLKKQRIDNTFVLGYGSRRWNPTAIPLDKIYEGIDVLISYHAPMRLNMERGADNQFDTEEINRFAAFRNPKIIFHGERKTNKETVLSNGTKVISCYGIVPYILTFYKEIEE